MLIVLFYTTTWLGLNIIDWFYGPKRQSISRLCGLLYAILLDKSDTYLLVPVATATAALFWSFISNYFVKIL
jgi:hypothetical protein